MVLVAASTLPRKTDLQGPQPALTTGSLANAARYLASDSFADPNALLDQRPRSRRNGRRYLGDHALCRTVRAPRGSLAIVAGALCLETIVAVNGDGSLSVLGVDRLGAPSRAVGARQQQSSSHAPSEAASWASAVTDRNIGPRRAFFASSPIERDGWKTRWASIIVRIFRVGF